MLCKDKSFLVVYFHKNSLGYQVGCLAFFLLKNDLHLLIIFNKNQLSKPENHLLSKVTGTPFLGRVTIDTKGSILVLGNTFNLKR